MTHIPKVELSTKQIVFTPGDGHDFARDTDAVEPDLTVTVINTTEHFISFHLELEAEGQTNPATWYTVEPNVCAKKPPGDRTRFHVNLLKAPLPVYGTTIPLGVKVFSAELADLAAVETVYLKILRPTKDLRVFFPLQDLSVYPGSRLKIPVLVYNLNPQMRQVTLGIEGVDPAWFPEGHLQTVWVDGSGSLETDFWCLPPATASTVHQLYRPIVQATIADESISASADGHLHILPFGRLHHRVSDSERLIPDQLVALSELKGGGVVYDWRLTNDSNAAQVVHLEASNLAPSLQAVSSPLVLPPGKAGQANVQVQARRPWLGWMRTHFIEMWPAVQHPDSDQPIPEITITPASQLLTLKVKPRIPLALQLVAGLLGGLALWTLWFLSPRPWHEGPVNTVRLLGHSNLVVSGSNDQTLRRWQVNRQPWLPNVRRLAPYNDRPDYSFDQAIRVMEVLPAQLGQVAVGLENGEIYIRNVDRIDETPPLGTPLTGAGPVEGQLDRVLDLAFTNDSRYLFSGHGSGTVRVWAFRRGQWHPDKKLYLGLPPDLSFAIASLAVSPDDDLVAIAGQFNRLVLWDWQSSPPGVRSPRPAVAYDIPYSYPQPVGTDEIIQPVTSRNSYLTSVAFASQNPDLMATADNAGFITLWDLEQLRACRSAAIPNPRLAEDSYGNRLTLIRAVDCPPESTMLAQWQATQQGSAIREVALDKTGCYLVSTGDDGHISLWPLTKDKEGKLTADSSQARITLANFPNQPLNSVDIHRIQGNVLLIAADTPGHRVQLYRQRVPDHGCQ